MVLFLTICFVILSCLLGGIVLIQQGKGDMGMGSLANSGTQLLFGGSGGQDIIEKITWVLGITFIFGALGLSMYQTRLANRSKLDGYVKESSTKKQKRLMNTK